MGLYFKFGFSERTLRFFTTVPVRVPVFGRRKDTAGRPEKSVSSFAHRNGSSARTPCPSGDGERLSGTSCSAGEKPGDGERLTDTAYSAGVETGGGTERVRRPFRLRLSCPALWLLTLTWLILCTVLLPSCGVLGEMLPGSTPVPPETAVAAMCATQKELPSGQLYASSAPEGEAGYVGDDLLAAFLGDGESPPWQMDGAAEFSFYLSYTSPVTFAVFRCTTRHGAEDLAKLCLARVRMYRNYWSGTEWQDAVDGAAVEVRGSDVFFVIAVNGGAVLRRGAEAIR